MKNETKLKVAAEEIKDILRKHDIAGVISLHSPGHGEFFLHLTTSYSCAYMPNDEEIRLYSKRADYATEEEHMAKKRDTSNMLRSFTDTTAFLFQGLMNLSKSLDELVGAEHTQGKIKRG